MRPSIRANKVSMKYLFFNELRKHCEVICRLGSDHTVLARITREVHTPGSQQSARR